MAKEERRDGKKLGPKERKEAANEERGMKDNTGLAFPCKSLHLCVAQFVTLYMFSIWPLISKQESFASY